MKPSSILSIVLILGSIGFVGYNVYIGLGSQAEVAAKVEELTPPSEKEVIKVNILEDPTLKEILGFRVYGKRPVGADASQLNRSNPFQGI